MERMKPELEAPPTVFEEQLAIIKRKLFAAYNTSLENRQEILGKIISEFEWYLQMRKLFAEKIGEEQKTEEKRTEDMNEYLDEASLNSARLKEFNAVYGIPAGESIPKFTTRELELFVQELKHLSLELFKDTPFTPEE